MSIEQDSNEELRQNTAVGRPAKGLRLSKLIASGTICLIVALACTNRVASVPGASSLAAIANQTADATAYQIGENTATANAGPVRLVRVSYLSGPVTWRPTGSAGWSNASNNLPMRQGAQIWTKPGSRAEIMFDDGSTMRLGGGAVATLQTLFSDDRGEFSEIKLNSGLSTFHLRNKLSRYQIDTPFTSVKSVGPAEFRLGVGSSVEVGCTDGAPEIDDGHRASTIMRPHDRVIVSDTTSPYRAERMAKPDPWDNFNENRDVIYNHHNQYVPSNIDLVSGDLDRYGDWHQDPRHGHVWAPRVHEANWRPYHSGHWVWVSPWGWTWVGQEEWGYAPYHYGTWIRESYGWAWVPGPAVQHWSPAVVDFVDDDRNVGWVALAPSEVVYPSAIDIGFHSGDWWVNFSIGQAASYYPSGRYRCEPRNWDNQYANQEVDLYNVASVYDGAGSRNYGRNSLFMPQNAVRYAGLTSASRIAFLGGGTYDAPGADPNGRLFQQGRSFSAAPGRGRNVFGPPSLRPGRSSYSASRQFDRAGSPPQRTLDRAVVRGRVSDLIAKHSARGNWSSQSSTRAEAITRGLGSRGIGGTHNGSPLDKPIYSNGQQRQQQQVRQQGQRQQQQRQQQVRQQGQRQQQQRQQQVRQQGQRQQQQRQQQVRQQGQRQQQQRQQQVRQQGQRQQQQRQQQVRQQGQRQQQQRQQQVRQQGQRQQQQRQQQVRQQGQRQQQQRQQQVRQQGQRQQQQRQQQVRQQGQRQQQQRQQQVRQQGQRQQQQRQQQVRQQGQRQQQQRQQRQPSRSQGSKGGGRQQDKRQHGG